MGIAKHITNMNPKQMKHLLEAVLDLNLNKGTITMHGTQSNGSNVLVPFTDEMRALVIFIVEAHAEMRQLYTAVDGIEVNLYTCPAQRMRAGMMKYFDDNAADELMNELNDLQELADQKAMDAENDQPPQKKQKGISDV